MNEVTLLFFSTFRDRVGENRVKMEIPEGVTVEEFKGLLATKYPQLEESLDFILVAVNKNYVFDEDLIPKGAEVAIFPPVSGGGDGPTIFSITEGELDLDAFSGIPNGNHIIGMRNILAHGYDRVDYEILWDAAMLELKPLRDAVRSLQQ